MSKVQDNLYIKGIYVYYNYVDRNLHIDLTPEDDKPFKHLILTGKNGSGKSTTLRAIFRELINVRAGVKSEQEYFLENRKNGVDLSYEYGKVELDYVRSYHEVLDGEDFLVVSMPAIRHFIVEQSDSSLFSLPKILSIQQKFYSEVSIRGKEIVRFRHSIPRFETEKEELLEEIENARNKLKVLREEGASGMDLLKIKNNIEGLKTQLVESRKRLEDRVFELELLEKKHNTIDPKISLSSYFEKYLIFQRKERVNAILEEESELEKLLEKEFNRLENTLQKLFEVPELKLKYNRKEGEFFYVQFPDGRTATFNELADGYGSVLYMLAEIMLQQEAFMQAHDLEEEPSGIVLIDEVETHLHISLQEKILPTLTQLFPKMQFIVCTHSPQVLASLENANIYDFTTKELVREYIGGLSYDVLSKSHFGISSEYSLKTTTLLNEAKSLLKKEEKSEQEVKRLKEISSIFNEISPELSHELYLFVNGLAL